MTRKIGTILTEADEPVSLRQLRALVRASNLRINNTALDDAVEVAVLTGAIRETPGARGSRLFSMPEGGPG